jgi:hypothetical protein
VGGSIAKVIVDYMGLAMQSLSIIAALIEAYRLLTKLTIFTSIPACCP